MISHSSRSLLAAAGAGGQGWRQGGYPEATVIIQEETIRVWTRV